MQKWQKTKKYKNWKYDGDINFDQILTTIEFGGRNLKFWDHLKHQIIEILELEIWRQHDLKIQNYGVLFEEFCVPEGTFELTNKFSSISAVQNIVSGFLAVHIASQTTSFQFSHFRHFFNFLHFSWFPFNFDFSHHLIQKSIPVIQLVQEKTDFVPVTTNKLPNSIRPTDFMFIYTIHEYKIRLLYYWSWTGWFNRSTLFGKK